VCVFDEELRAVSLRLSHFLSSWVLEDGEVRTKDDGSPIPSPISQPEGYRSNNSHRYKGGEYNCQDSEDFDVVLHGVFVLLVNDWWEVIIVRFLAFS
jgi:hypothetical protein